ncbi:efflux RND transporter periplasmic adaptor subunit [Aquabacter spiritensis]|uniref:Multidrug efflux system membrane fusion protein n=1 Tax=Aquabacter spiritensis TaxID=933073 RepID=A0A4R3LTR1_9HYPH|nr:efflux RND transporter periplasmic adaptor subunit [Aquabacter spiritensis]TCT03942.1 multidrug efflux system membrane fusion protein [Aquabacter spiritensis]
MTAQTPSPSKLRRLIVPATLVLLIGGGLSLPYLLPLTRAEAADPAAQAAPAAVPVSVATVEAREAPVFDDFSGRLEAVERVEVRARVAGAIQSVHFREGDLVQAGALLITVDPAPYQAEVDRLQAQVAAAEARLALAKADLDRGQRLFDSRTVSQRDLDERLNASKEAAANLKAAEAALRAADLSLSYTEVRAPVAGRVGRLEITAGNLISAGPGSLPLTTLVSVDPVYAAFSADEQVVTRALRSLASRPGKSLPVERIPVEMTTAIDEDMSAGRTYQGQLQLIDNQVDPRTGTVRVRAVFANVDGRLIPGQFVRLRMGRTDTAKALLITERAVGTDQDKKFVLVVDGDNKAAYREVSLGATVNGLRIVKAGLRAGERIVVNGLHRVKPGATLDPQMVAMEPIRTADAAR